VTLTVNQIPSHSHPPLASTASGNSSTPNNRVWSESVLDPYSSIAPSLQMNANAIAPSGGSQPHDNLMPYLAISFILSLFGVFPTQS
jgi:microcystin-dependent protein